MINILYLNPAGCIGGAEKSLLDLIDNLDRNRFRPLAVLLSPGPLESMLRKRGIDCRIVPLPAALLGASRRSCPSALRLLPALPFLLPPVIIRLYRLIREEEITLVHTNGIKAHLLAVIPARLAGRPLVWHFRDLPGRGGLGRTFRLLARFFPGRIIANSNAVKDELGGLDRIEVVYNGVEISQPRTEAEISRARKDLRLGPGEIAIGTIGHFAPLKGYEDLLRAAVPVIAKVPSARLLITGDAVYPAYRDYRLRLENEAAWLGLKEKVIFTGSREDPSEILNALDIFVLPSRSEGFGRANLEAMAAGLPVVSTRVGGIPEVVSDGETGILVPHRDPEALAEAIIALAEDRERRAVMGRAGRRRAEEFSLERMLAGTVAVYDSILPERRR